MFNDNLLDAHLDIAMYNRKTIDVVQPVRIIWYRVLMTRGSRTNAAGCSRYQWRAAIADVTPLIVTLVLVLIMVVIVVTVARTNGSTGQVRFDPR